MGCSGGPEGGPKTRINFKGLSKKRKRKEKRKAVAIFEYNNLEYKKKSIAEADSL